MLRSRSTHTGETKKERMQELCFVQPADGPGMGNKESHFPSSSPPPVMPNWLQTQDSQNFSYQKQQIVQSKGESMLSKIICLVSFQFNRTSCKKTHHSIIGSVLHKALVFEKYIYARFLFSSNSRSVTFSNNVITLQTVNKHGRNLELEKLAFS